MYEWRWGCCLFHLYISVKPSPHQRSSSVVNPSSRVFGWFYCAFRLPTLLLLLWWLFFVQTSVGDAIVQFRSIFLKILSTSPQFVILSARRNWAYYANTSEPNRPLAHLDNLIKLNVLSTPPVYQPEVYKAWMSGSLLPGWLLSVWLLWGVHLQYLKGCTAARGLTPTS